MTTPTPSSAEMQQDIDSVLAYDEECDDLGCIIPNQCPHHAAKMRIRDYITKLESENAVLRKEYEAMRSSITFCNAVANDVRGAGSALVGIGKIKCRTEDCLSSLTIRHE